MSSRLRAVLLGTILISLCGTVGTAFWAFRQDQVVRQRLDRLQLSLSETNKLAMQTSDEAAGLKKNIDSLKLRMTISDIAAAYLPSRVDLTKTIFQPIEGGFSVSISNVNKHLTSLTRSVGKPEKVIAASTPSYQPE